MNIILMKDIKKYYKNLAKTYDKDAREKAKYKADIIIQDKLLKLIPKKSKVLDLGCGTGLSSKKFIEQEHEVIGIDVSSEMLSIAKKYKFKKLIKQNIEKPLKFPNNYFDIAVMVGVMEFIEKPLTLFKRINKVLKTNGKLGITIHYKLNKSTWVKNYYRKEIEPIFKKSGFKITYRKKQFGYISRAGDEVTYLIYILEKIK